MKQLLTKLNLIMGEVDRIQKDAQNQAMNYTYASEKAIKETLHPLFVKYKVLMTISTSNPRYLSADKGNIFNLDITYAFYDVDSGEKLEGTFVGTGNGRDDKGNYAAVTGAIKYILTSTFLIPTGDDPENEDAPIRREVVKPVSRPPMPAERANDEFEL